VVGQTVILPCTGVLANGAECCPPDQVDFCGDCRGTNLRMDICGECGGSSTSFHCVANAIFNTPPNPPVVNPSECPGTVKDSFPLDITMFDISSNSSIVVSYIGDVDNNGVNDLVLGVPGYALLNSNYSCIIDNPPRLPTTWKTDWKYNATSVGRLIVVLLDSAGDVISYTNIVAGGNYSAESCPPLVHVASYNSSIPSHHYTIPCLSEHSLFGFSVASTNDLSVDGSPDLVVGAPLALEHGALALLYLNSTAHLINVAFITPNQTTSANPSLPIGNFTEGDKLLIGLGTSVGSMILDGTSPQLQNKP